MNNDEIFVFGRELRQRTFKHETSAITEFYFHRPEGHEVDHQIPLHHPDVCGIHCIANLQYLTIEANRYKSNRFNPDDFSYS